MSKTRWEVKSVHSTDSRTLGFGLWTLDFKISSVRGNHQRIAELVREFQGKAFDAHYLAYFECFNQKRYFEAHEVLEPLWLAARGGPLDLFYKGLIQLAGAFVHLQKNRRAPAIALFDLARRNLQRYPNHHEGLNLQAVLHTIAQVGQDISKDHNSNTSSYVTHAPKVFVAKPES